jgi:mono/diheme cytochrome c family protein
MLLVFASVLALSLLAQAPAPKEATASAASGAEMYQSYCASCHGPKGVGQKNTQEAVVPARVASLSAYLESIQVK